MIFGPIRAVAIDDKPTHLLSITTGLSAVGIPCMAYWYNRATSKLVPKAKQHEFIRLIFMDLNLAELGPNPDAATLAGNVITVLEQIVAKNAGPYILVFWTEVTGKIADVRARIYERMKESPPPIEILELAKRHFLPAAKGDGEDLDQDLQALFTALSRKLSKLSEELTKLTGAKPELNVAAGWESRATEAAARSVNEVTAQAREDVGGDPNKVADSLKILLSAICRAAAGQTHAEAEPARALDAGMSEILTDQLTISVDEKEYAKTVRTTLEPVIKAKTKFRNGPKISASLNTFFHIDDQVKVVKTTARGAVIPGAALFTEKVLGGTHVDLLRKEFMLDVGADKRALADEMDKAAELLLVEVGADCDHAQGKPRTLRYLVAFEFNQKFVTLVKGKDLKHQALQLLGPWSINNGCYLIVSCRRFFTWQAAKAPKGKVRYRLRNSVVNKLLHHYSSLSTRPGIVEFFP